MVRVPLALLEQVHLDHKVFKEIPDQLGHKVLKAQLALKGRAVLQVQYPDPLDLAGLIVLYLVRRAYKDHKDLQVFKGQLDRVVLLQAQLARVVLVE